MAKARKITYWISTIWLALGLVSTGIFQTLGVQEEVQFILELGYPSYLLMLLGVSKLLAAVAILAPGALRIKEWAYAGVVFTMSGAIYSHLASGQPEGIFPPILLMALTVISWYTRPESRKLALHASLRGK